MKKIILLFIATLNVVLTASVNITRPYHFRSSGTTNWLYGNPLIPLTLGTCGTALAIKALEENSSLSHNSLTALTSLGIGTMVAAVCLPLGKELSSFMAVLGALSAGSLYYIVRPGERAYSAIKETENFFGEDFIKKITNDKEGIVNVNKADAFEYMRRLEVSRRKLKKFKNPLYEGHPAAIIIDSNIHKLDELKGKIVALLD